MHDFFDILGLPDNAGASEVRRACARRVWRSHPDFGQTSVLTPVRRVAADAPPTDIAIDFVDMTTLVERMQAAFFESGS